MNILESSIYYDYYYYYHDVLLSSSRFLGCLAFPNMAIEKHENIPTVPDQSIFRRTYIYSYHCPESPY